MKIVSSEEMRAIDRVTSECHGVASTTLMENAGAGVASFVRACRPEAKRITVVCGKGNNGGDGFVAARHLREAGCDVRVVLLAAMADVQGDAAFMLRKLGMPPTCVASAEGLKSAEIQAALQADGLVDAILGSGFRPPVEGLYAAAIEALNAAHGFIVAVDVPSGADSDAMNAAQTALRARADAVITFTAPRPAHVFGELTAGPIVIHAIGSPAEAVVSSLNLHVTTARDVAPLLAPRRSDANKGSFGHVLVIGGSFGKAGAPAMAGMGALRAGAGLVTVATPLSVLGTVAGFAPELMTAAMPETDAGTISIRSFEFGRLDSLADGKHVIAIGPGAGQNSETAELVRTCVERYLGPLVLDADGLNAFSGCIERLDGRKRSVILTPHPGEMARLLATSVDAVQRDRIGLVRAFAQEHQVTVALKGQHTLIASPEGAVWVNPTGNPGMATGGTGDILTGMIAGLVAQNPTRVFEAICAAVFLHGLAGDAARDSMGEQSMIATDLLTHLPQAFFRCAADSRESLVKLCGEWPMQGMS